jgi:hypothetical protein
MAERCSDWLCTLVAAIFNYIIIYICVSKVIGENDVIKNTAVWYIVQYSVIFSAFFEQFYLIWIKIPISHCGYIFSIRKYIYLFLAIFTPIFTAFCTSRFVFKDAFIIHSLSSYKFQIAETCSNIILFWFYHFCLRTPPPPESLTMTLDIFLSVLFSGRVHYSSLNLQKFANLYTVN